MALKKSINYKTRIFLLIMVFTWIVAFVLFGIFYFREKEFKAESMDARLQIYNALLLNTLDDGLDQAMAQIDLMVNEDSLRVTVMDTDGIVIFDTHGIKPGTEHGNRREIKEAMTVGSGFTLSRTSTSDNRQYFYSAMKDGEYIVRTSIPYDLDVIQALKGESVYLWIVIIISIVLSVIAYFASRQLGANVDKLRDFAIRAEAGEHVESSSYDFLNDELGEISSHIINIYNAGQRAAKDRDEYYRNLLEQEKEKIRIKHQLTNNINHEIKTPVHAIQGCLETVMINRDKLSKEQIVDFVEKGLEQVKRLCNLLNDISIITRISDGPLQIQKSMMDIVPVLNDMRDEISIMPQAKQMRLNLQVPSSVKIVANKGLIESIFRNLIQNSLAYSGGRDIFISLLRQDDECYEFSVSDNGIGIDKKHYDKIFERFYRVDDGRSRKMGGTGLGLSIVKNAVICHGGEIRVRTRYGGGLEFVFTLKKK